MLNSLGRIYRKLGSFFLIFRLNNNFFVPKNFRIKYAPKICYKSIIKFDENSIIKLNGYVEIRKSVLDLTGSEVSFCNSKIFKSHLKFQKSTFSTSDNLKLLKSNFKINSSSVNLGEEVTFEEFSVEMVNSELTTGNFILFQKVPPQTALLYLERGKVVLGSNNRMQARLLIQGGKFSTGENVFINHGSEIRSIKSIQIGSNCFISYDVFIIDNNSHSVHPESRIQEIKNGFPLTTFQSDELKPVCKQIVIKDNVWIGIRSMILKGVTLNENSIVSAGTVLTKDVPSNTIAYKGDLKFKGID